MSLRAFYKRFEHHINTAAFLSGFVFDSLAFAHVDHTIIRIALLAWLLFALVAIVFYAAKRLEAPRETFLGRVLDGVVAVLPFFIQFAFGAILSGTLIFFSHSASLSVSWPFLILIIAFIAGNEAFRGRYASLVFQAVAFFVASFLYATLVTPVLLKKVGLVSFIVAGIGSVILFFILTRLLRYFARERYTGSRHFIWTGVIMFFILFQALYALNFIPPLPLSLEEIGIYHLLQRTPGGDYILSYEPGGTFSFSTISRTFHLEEGKPAYAFSAVSAPEGISAMVAHEWYVFDQDQKRWTLSYREMFPIVGGREGGYRGYSTKETIELGRWRVDVRTASGQLIGRTNFKVVEATGTIKKETLVR